LLKKAIVRGQISEIQEAVPRGLSEVSVRARISSFLTITMSMILADLLWTDLTLVLGHIFAEEAGMD